VPFVRRQLRTLAVPSANERCGAPCRPSDPAG
jgi:hypothetical protein